MGGVAISGGSRDVSSPERLIQAVLDVWESQGGAGASVRSIAQATGLQVSSIYHHFGDMERLFLSAHDAARAAAEQWCAARLDDLADTAALSPEAFPALLATLIDDWSYGQRRLAFAWRECQLMAARDTAFLPALQGWQRLWAGFWQELCGRCGLSGFGRITNNLFDGESMLHLMQWRRTVDRACLDETCRGWGEWLAGRLAPEGPWRRFARTEANRLMPSLPANGVVAEQIAIAAADIVAERGVAGLTHRAVAARAGLSLGVVSYNYRTSGELVRAAFEAIYRRVTSFAPRERSSPATSERGAVLVDRWLDQGADEPGMLALNELLIAVARDPQFSPLSLQLRYLRGRTSGGVLAALIGDGRAVSPLDAALFSSLGGGQHRATVGITPDEVRRDSRQNMLLIFDTLSSVDSALK